jgi:hypothetical protein
MCFSIASKLRCDQNERIGAGPWCLDRAVWQWMIEAINKLVLDKLAAGTISIWKEQASV